MRKTLVSLCAAGALLLSSSAVRADIVAFGYSASPMVNPSDGTSTIWNNSGGVKTSSIVFSAASGAATFDTATQTPSQFIIYNMATTSTAAAGKYDGFGAVPFNLSVKLTDLTSGKQNTFAFNGNFTADTVSSGSMHVNPATQGIQWTPQAGPAWTSPVSETLTVGANNYKVTLISWTASGAPSPNPNSPSSPGSILAQVEVVPGSSGNQPPPNASPEPTSLVLAGLALPALFMARRRLKKAQAV